MNAEAFIAVNVKACVCSGYHESDWPNCSTGHQLSMPTLIENGKSADDDHIFLAHAKNLSFVQVTSFQ